ncbi:hypothetical protein T07_8076 [Trichinella nelsoni]|uniref:Uncharacterized protein n=1 Tax=Trichinella nelsoni TaxID=6336 RepID=A0A0V0S008_9BILA|nr:hypothetical protein T07_8076 [Trichinella nelsoni]
MIRFVWPPTVIVNRTQSAGGFQPRSGFADGQSTEQLARKDVQVALIVYLYNEHKRSPMNVGNACKHPTTVNTSCAKASFSLDSVDNNARCKITYPRPNERQSTGAPPSLRQTNIHNGTQQVDER